MLKKGMLIKDVGTGELFLLVTDVTESIYYGPRICCADVLSQDKVVEGILCDTSLI